MSDSDAGQADGPGSGDVSGGQGGATGPLDRLERLREEISQCDRELIEVLSRRRALVQEIAEVKARLGFPVTDPRREAAVVRRAARLARDAGLDEELIRNLTWKIMSSSRIQQYAPPGEEEPPGDS